MKSLSLIFVICMGLAVFILVFFFSNLMEPQLPPKNKPVQQSQFTTTPSEIPRQILSEDEIETGLKLGTGSYHLKSLEVIMTWLRHQEVLASEDQAILLSYLEQEQPTSITSGEWEERVNEILNFLRSQPNGVPGLADLMLHMAEHDPNTVLRMYAMQHIFLWIPDEPDEGKRGEMMSYLKRVADTPSDIHSGAAVMFLSDLELRNDQKQKTSDEETINLAALRLVENQEVNPAALISALHTCTERGVTDALPVARQLAADETKMIPLRKAAIHAIGRLGEPEDVVFLDKLARAESNLKAAIDPAKKNLQEP
jgi:hypothetical protein